LAQQGPADYGAWRKAVSDRTKTALSIAGSDSSAAAGIQADLKTFAALGVYGATVITAVTAQNTLGVTAIHGLPSPIVAAQIDAVFSDLFIKAVKTGMLGGADAIEAVADGLARWAADIPVVVDPVMVSTSGSRLLEKGAESALRQRLMPLATLVTPNLHEAAALLCAGVAANEEEAKAQAVQLFKLGPRAVLIKGGHAAGSNATDIFYDGTQFRSYSAPRIATRNTRGTGCTLASAIAAFLAKGRTMQDAISEAKTYLQGAIEHSDDLNIGAGPGPVSHFYRIGANLTTRCE
jgi:hydroxymethylpyrimidine/phosphomethylpyrimidine kinase